RRRHTRLQGDWSSDVCSSDLYEVPRFTDRAVNTLLGNWRFSFLISAHPGFPYSPVTGADNSLTGVGQDRPNAVANPYVKNLNTQIGRASCRERVEDWERCV